MAGPQFVAAMATAAAAPAALPALLPLLLLLVGELAAAPPPDSPGPAPGHGSPPGIPELAARLSRQRTGARIVGGQDAFAGQFPYQALVLGEDDRLCGGALIASQWVLTAAQCVADSPGTIWVFLGVTDWQSDEPQKQLYAARRTLVHPEFDASTLANDIALLGLMMDATITEFVEPVELERGFCGDWDLEGRVAVASGWGQTSDFESTSQQLKWVPVEVIPNRQCGEMLGTQITDSMLCTLGVRGEIGGICYGDQGGPLVAGQELVGVASAVPADSCTNGRPHLFTRVACYRNWIRDLTGIA